MKTQEQIVFEHDMGIYVDLYEQKSNLIGHDFNLILAERAKRKQKRDTLIVVLIFAGAFAGWILTNLWR